MHVHNTRVNVAVSLSQCTHMYWDVSKECGFCVALPVGVVSTSTCVHVSTYCLHMYIQTNIVVIHTYIHCVATHDLCWYAFSVLVENFAKFPNVNYSEYPYPLPTVMKYLVLCKLTGTKTKINHYPKKLVN